MEKNFIPFELALELKELGFNEECFYVKKISEPEFWYTQSDYEDFPEQIHKEVLIPLWCQAFDFLLPKLHRVYIQYHGDQSGRLNHGVTGFITSFNGKEECLKKLIELCKN